MKRSGKPDAAAAASARHASKRASATRLASPPDDHVVLRGDEPIDRAANASDGIGVEGLERRHVQHADAATPRAASGVGGFERALGHEARCR